MNAETTIFSLVCMNKERVIQGNNTDDDDSGTEKLQNKS
jgi:hypothetical protein